jgi:hypothetical protein
MNTLLEIAPTDPELEEDEPRFAHIVRRDEQMVGYIEGVPIRALCGKVWVPTRDPERYPVCGLCREIMEQIKRENV